MIIRKSHPVTSCEFQPLERISQRPCSGLVLVSNPLGVQETQPGHRTKPGTHCLQQVGTKGGARLPSSRWNTAPPGPDQQPAYTPFLSLRAPGGADLLIIDLWIYLKEPEGGLWFLFSMPPLVAGPDPRGQGEATTQRMDKWMALSNLGESK